MKVRIGSKKNPAIVVINTWNTFLQSENGHSVFVAIRGKVVELIVRLNPELHWQYINVALQEASASDVRANF